MNNIYIMKKYLILAIAVLLTTFVSAQTVVFHENFEAPSYGDSLISTADSNGVVVSFKPWGTSTYLYRSGLRSDTNILQKNRTVYLKSIPFSTVGNTNIILEFSQIAKLHIYDGGIVEVSTNNGTTWTTLTSALYKGSGTMVQNKFCENSYTEWLSGDTTTVVTNSWWKDEKFDISSLVSNAASVMVRFRYTTSGQAIASGRKGWLIDDVKVTASPCELVPPVITIISYVTGTISASSAPANYPITAYIKDASGIDSAYVQYQVNGGAFTYVKMTHVDSLYTGNIPFPGWGKTVTYRIVAVDSSCAYVVTYYPASGYYSFFTQYTGTGLLNDVGVSQITSPIGGVVVGTAVPVMAILKNFASTTLTSATIYTSLNGVLQPTPYLWTGSLAANSVTSAINVCTLNSLTAGTYNLKVWAVLPNGNQDEYNLNDTAYMTFNACLSVLNGAYTIGGAPGPTNYATFNDALTGLLQCGINGPVVFNVAAGVYSEQITIPNIPGTSSTNTITFQGATTDSTLYIIKNAATTAATNFVVRFNNAQYVTFKYLTIQPANATYANAVVFMNGANNISLLNNLLIGTQTVFTDSNQYIVRTTANSNYSFININNNRFNNGNLGLYFNSALTTSTTKIVVDNNYFYNTNGRPAQLQHIKALEFGNNTVNISTAQTSSSAIYMDSITGQFRIHDNYLSNLYGALLMEMRTSHGASGTEGLIFNNFMYAGGTAAPYICNFSGGLNNTKVLFNTFVGYNATAVVNLGTTYGANNNLTIENNILAGNNTGVPLIIITTAPTTYTLDYNDYYTSTGTTLGKLASTAYTTLATWRTATTQESHSLTVNPMFTSTGVPNDGNTALVASATPITGITTDIFGRPRASIPSVGAYEVFLIPNDAGVIDIITPAATETENTSIPVKVVVRNFGTDPITSMTVYYKVNAGTPVPFNYVGNIASLSTDTIIMPNITVALGTTNICAYTALTGDVNTSNDQFCKNFVGGPMYDAQLKSTYALTGGCALTTQQVKVTIKNLGAATINQNCNVSYQVKWGTNVVTEPITTPINPGDTLVYTFTTPVNLAVTTHDSIFTIKTWVKVLNDNVPANDSSSTTVSSLHTPPSPVPNSVTIPYATPATVTATSPTGDPIYWYGQPTGGSYFLKGTQYPTSILYADTTYYLESSTNFVLNATIGTGTVQNTTYGYPCPYGMDFTGARGQYLIKASELIAAGVQPGEIQSCGFNVVTPTVASSYGTAPTNTHLRNYTIKIGATAQNALTTTYVTGLTQVYFNSMYNDVTGWNMHQFSTPFVWNGTSNIVIEICHDKYVTASDYGSNAICNQTATSFVSSAYNYSDAANQCSAAATATASQRPNIKLVSNIAGCTSTPRVPLTVTVGAQPANDVGVTAILSPVTGVLLTNHETVKVNITNHGNATASNFNVSFKVDNGTPKTELFTGSILPNAVGTYTFTSNFADLSTVGSTYKITAYTTMVGDATTINDTTIVYVTNNPLVYCTSAALYTYDENIGNVTFAGINNGNPLPATNNSTTFHLYSDFTALTPGQIYMGLPYPISVSIINAYTAYGGLCNVYIDYNHDGTFQTNEKVFSGSYSTANTITGNITIPTTATPGLTRMRVVADEGNSAPPCGTYSYGETEDYTVNIIPPIPKDAGIIKVKFSTNYIPYDPSPTYMSPMLTIRNFGLDSLVTDSIYYNLNGTISLFTKTNVPPLATSAVDSFYIPSFTVAEGLNTLTAYTDLWGDINFFNDTSSASIFKEHLASIPYTDNFDINSYWFATDTNAGVAITNLWQQGVPASNVINSAHSPNNAWKTLLNGNCPVSNYSVLYSPLFNFAANMGDTLKFWQWRQFGTNAYGTIEYLNVFGAWKTLGAANDPNATNWYNSLNGWTGTGTGWEFSSYKVSNLSDVANTVQFRFIFNSMTSTDNTKNGWAIDDIDLTLYQIAQDAGVSLIVTPGSTSTVGDSIAPTVTVKNYGLNPISNVPIKYMINGGTAVPGTFPGPLTTGNTSNYTFNTKYAVATSNYTICAATVLNGDSFYQNDSSCQSVTVNPAAIDVGVTAFTSPSNWAGQGEPVTVSITIKNFGTTPQGSIPVFYKRGVSPPVNATWTGTPLNLNETVQYTFTTTFNTPLGSSFNICAGTVLPNDVYAANDQICKTVAITLPGIDEHSNSNDLWLGQNIPNPSNGLTTINFNLPQAGEVNFNITDLLGQVVYSTQSKELAGKHKIEFNTNNLSDGVYYYSIEYNGKRLVKKMLISK